MTPIGYSKDIKSVAAAGWASLAIGLFFGLLWVGLVFFSWCRRRGYQQS